MISIVCESVNMFAWLTVVWHSECKQKEMDEENERENEKWNFLEKKWDWVGVEVAHARGPFPWEPHTCVYIWRPPWSLKGAARPNLRARQFISQVMQVYNKNSPAACSCPALIAGPCSPGGRGRYLTSNRFVRQRQPNSKLQRRKRKPSLNDCLIRFPTTED